MSFDAKTILANLVEQERIKGHHSPEGRAIRTIARALSGWSGGNLLAADVIVLCDQAVEDWLKARLKRSAWSVEAVPALALDAAEGHLITRADALRLKRLHALREAGIQHETIPRVKIEAALEFCIELLEKHW
jgi:hypothetical protein